MRYPSLLLTALLIAGVTGAVHLCTPAISQTAGLIPTGNSSLPAGQYMLTNLRTGQAVYLEIDASGRLLAQDPKALQWSVSPLNQYGATTYGSPQPLSGTPAATTSDTTLPTPPPAGGSYFGGLLRQGVQSIINNKLAPATPPVATPQ